MSLDTFQFVDNEIQNLMTAEPSPETDNSFTALLELPPNQAVKLLHSPEKVTPNVFSTVFSAIDNSPETTSSILQNSRNSVKQEPIELGYLHNSSTKRKDRDEKKVNLSVKKMKIADGDKLPYIHVRFRRGEATDNHSLAERARREKINLRMKFLQELVPGCNKISGTTMVLDAIINHVQSLQLQVELLSMKLAAVHPKIDIDLDTLFSSECGSPMECNFTGMVSPSWWVDQVNRNAQHISHPNVLTNLVMPDNSFFKL